MTTKPRYGRKFTLFPIEDDISFRDLQKKHEHYLKYLNYVTSPINRNEYKQNIKRHAVFKGYLPESEILKNKDAGSHANVLVYPYRNKPDDKDEVPEYIYITKPAKRHGYDTVSRGMKNGRITFTEKGRPQINTQRALVDTMVAGYLHNNHYGHVIPVYEGTGMQTCSCCTNRNRENVRNVLGLPADPDNTKQNLKNGTWFQTRTKHGPNEMVSVYPIGNKQRANPVKIDPAFQLSDPATRVNWATSATLEDPVYYKRALPISLPDYNRTKDSQNVHRNFPKSDSNSVSLPYIYSNYLPPYKKDSDHLSGEPTISINYGYESKRINSADNRYRESMNTLRKHTNKRQYL